MGNRLNLSPELSEAVDRARAGARDAGELLDPPTEAPKSPFSPPVRSVLADWRASGDFDRAVAEVVSGDSDLATQ